jgi:cell shape-determining protein MreC
MGQKRAKVISRDAFMQSFVEAEVIMRRNLATRIQMLIDNETNEDVKSGLVKAQQEVFGKVETNDVG